jgi:hypothetical protein
MDVHNTCMHACVCVCVCVCGNRRRHRLSRANLSLSLSRTHTHSLSLLHTHALSLTHTHPSLSLCVCVTLHVCVCLCACVHVCVCVSVSVCVCAQFLIPRQQTAVATHKDVRAPGIPRLNMGNLSSVSHQHYAASARSRYPSKKCQDVPNLSNSVGRKMCQVFRTSTSTLRLWLGPGTPGTF